MGVRPGKTVQVIGEFAICERLVETPLGEQLAGFCVAGPLADPFWHFGSVEQALGAIEVLRSETWRRDHRP